MTSLSNPELHLLLDYIEELDAVIEADDGDLFPMPLLDKHEAAKEVLYAIIERR